MGMACSQLLGSFHFSLPSSLPSVVNEIVQHFHLSRMPEANPGDHFPERVQILGIGPLLAGFSSKGCARPLQQEIGQYEEEAR
jgi:hypothetical protein